jgi:hypothetical protein
MRNYRTYILAMTLAAMAAPGLPQTGHRQYQPFTATLKEQYWTESGRYAGSHTTFARAADGSYAFISDKAAPDDKDQKPIAFFSFRFNVARRWLVETEPFTQTAVVTPIVEDSEIDSAASVYGTCDWLSDGTWKPLGQSTMLGFKVIEVEVDKTEHSITKEWVAPALNCFALKHTFVENEALRTNLEVTSIDLSEPDRALFEVPPGYERVSPLEMEARYKARFPKNELYGRSVYKLEERYQSAVAAAKQRQ